MSCNSPKHTDSTIQNITMSPFYVVRHNCQTILISKGKLIKRSDCQFSSLYVFVNVILIKDHCIYFILLFILDSTLNGNQFVCFLFKLIKQWFHARLCNSDQTNGNWNFLNKYYIFHFDLNTVKRLLYTYHLRLILIHPIPCLY